MQAFLWILYILQIFVAFGLVWIVMSQTNKDQGMGGAIGGGADQGSSRYKGGYEEKLDALAGKLAYFFLGLSFLVAVIAHHVR